MAATQAQFSTVLTKLSKTETSSRIVSCLIEMYCLVIRTQDLGIFPRIRSQLESIVLELQQKQTTAWNKTCNDRLILIYRKIEALMTPKTPVEDSGEEIMRRKRIKLNEEIASIAAAPKEKETVVVDVKRSPAVKKKTPTKKKSSKPKLSKLSIQIPEKEVKVLGKSLMTAAAAAFQQNLQNRIAMNNLKMQSNGNYSAVTPTPIAPPPALKLEDIKGNLQRKQTVVVNPKFNSDYLYVAQSTVQRVMLKALPKGCVVESAAKEMMQELMTEFLLFLYSEAKDTADYYRERPIHGRSVVDALYNLGFDNHADVVRVYHTKIKEMQEKKIQERKMKNAELKKTSPLVPLSAEAASSKSSLAAPSKSFAPIHLMAPKFTYEKSLEEKKQVPLGSPPALVTDAASIPSTTTASSPTIAPVGAVAPMAPPKVTDTETEKTTNGASITIHAPITTTITPTATSTNIQSLDSASSNVVNQDATPTTALENTDVPKNSYLSKPTVIESGSTQ